MREEPRQGHPQPSVTAPPLLPTTLAKMKVAFGRVGAALAETRPRRSHRTSTWPSRALAAALLSPSFLCTLRPGTASSPPPRSPITDTCSSACRSSPSGRPSRRSDVPAPLELNTAPVFLLRPAGGVGSVSTVELVVMLRERKASSYYIRRPPTPFGPIVRGAHAPEVHSG